MRETKTFVIDMMVHDFDLYCGRAIVFAIDLVVRVDINMENEKFNILWAIPAYADSRNDVPPNLQSYLLEQVKNSDKINLEVKDRIDMLKEVVLV